MRKKLLAIILGVLLSLSMSACSSGSEDKVMTYADGYFIVEEYWAKNAVGYYIMHAEDTGVKYFMTIASHGRSITPLYNADGTLQVADGYEVEIETEDN